jgi:hypothetical protein
LLLQSSTPSEPPQNRKKENFAATANRPSLSAQTICLETNAKKFREKQTKHKNKTFRKKIPEIKRKKEKQRAFSKP